MMLWGMKEVKLQYSGLLKLRKENDTLGNDTSPVVWGFRIQPTFAIARVVRGD